MRIVMLMLVPLMFTACTGQGVSYDTAKTSDENRPINTYR